MVNVKRKGTNWEREARNLLEEKLDGIWKRVAGSGALGTNLNEPILKSDIVGKINAFTKTFRFEAKVGYGGSKQFTLKKEWLDKIREEADSTFSIPGIICKFSGATGKSKHFVVLDLDAFIEIILEANKLKNELNKIYDNKRDHFK